jgi:hypothetical protein
MSLSTIDDFEDVMHYTLRDYSTSCHIKPSTLVLVRMPTSVLL